MQSTVHTRGMRESHGRVRALQPARDAERDGSTQADELQHCKTR